MRKIIFLLFISLVFLPKLGKANICFDDGQFWATAIQLQGKIAGKYAIELQIKPVGELPVFNKNSGECVSIEGFYAYLSQAKPIHLNGKFCPTTREISLNTSSSNTSAEKFEGKWNTSNQTIIGTWTQISTGKEFEFSVEAVEKQISTQQQLRFFDFLKSYFPRVDLGPEDLAIFDIRKENGANLITGIDFGWNGEVQVFSNTQFVVSTFFSSTAYSSSLKYSFQLLPSKSTSGIYVLAVLASDFYEKIQMDELDGAEGTNDYRIALYYFDGKEIQEKTELFLPEKAEITWESSYKNENMLESREVNLFFNRIGITGKDFAQKLKWESGQFTEF